MSQMKRFSYAYKRSPATNADPAGGSSKRAFFYRACARYERRFKRWPPELLWDHLWLQAEQEWSKAGNG